MKGTLAVPVTEFRRLWRFQLSRGGGSTRNVVLMMVRGCMVVVMRMVVMVEVSSVLVMNVGMVTAGVLVKVEPRARDGDARREERRN